MRGLTAWPLLPLAGLSLVTACSEDAAPTPDIVAIPAVAETESVGTVGDDAADDPAIWRNPDDPSQSLIIGTDKKAGIHVYDLQGRQKSFLAAEAVNNIDIRTVSTASGDVILVGASDRRDREVPRLALYTLDSENAALVPLANTVIGIGEAYGFCFGVLGADDLRAMIITKEGSIIEMSVTLSDGAPSIEVQRTFKVETQAEGCVVDDRTGMLYVGEENVGIWSYDLRRPDPKPLRFAVLAEGELVADVEGLALAPDGERGGYLLASSQGNNSFAIYDLPSGQFRTRFIVEDGVIDTVSDTDGIELMLGDFGPDYSGGIFVAQDGDNGDNTQNFKFLSWDAILQALNL
ncbi:phytase [Parasphingorhabdus cellanae]|uniref:Phytase n=1 Tax=Parasphingorhabdus cellanae TaxID=2806553 RepID=A0ABX7T2E2_9SPHN|nr:phytase [Parasphingorhabdus cellanae]QTD54707.1 phytase [Parasphingorhabdus cellanae]